MKEDSSSTPSLDASEWPSNVKLLVPGKWKSSTGVEDEMCFLRYCPSDGLIKVISLEDTDRVIDIIDTQDIVGANIEILLNETTGKEDLKPMANGNAVRSYNEPPSDQLRDLTGKAKLHVYVYPRFDSSKVTWSRWFFNGFSSLSALQGSPDPRYKRSANPTKLGPRYAHHRSFTVAPVEDLKQVTDLVLALRKLATRHQKTRKFLVILNPFSGKKNGATVFSKIVQPMLIQASIEWEVCSTTHANHATERMQITSEKDSAKDISQYDGLILIGGDGLVHEVLNGIMRREDSKQVLETLQVGVIGCGSCNGFSNTITYESQEKSRHLEETFIICKGKTTKTDISRYYTTSNSYVSHLALAYALVADADIESECIRWLGQLRVEAWIVLRIIFLRRYRARLSYLPVGAGSVQEPLPGLNEPVPHSWRTIEDDFIVFWASQSNHAGKGCLQSPESRLNDGVFQIMVIRGNVSRYRLVRIMLAVDDGSHVNMPGNEMITCRAYRLEPLVEGSFNDLDGEVVEPGPIQAQVLPGIVQILSATS